MMNEVDGIMNVANSNANQFEHFAVSENDSSNKKMSCSSSKPCFAKKYQKCFKNRSQSIYP